MSNILDPSPAMPESVFSFFKEYLYRGKCYLEYGCGGSTIFAAKVAKIDTIISVESDKQ